MTVVNQVMIEVLNVVARGLDGTQTTTPVATAAQDTASTPSTTSGGGSNNNSSQQSSQTQSPLLFFVALGFGVVFTNLWYVLISRRPPLTCLNSKTGSSSV